MRSSERIDQRIWLGIGLVLAAGCNGDPVSRERLTTKLTTATKDAADLLATVKDKPSAEAALPKLATLVNEMNALDEGFGRLDTDGEVYSEQQETEVLQRHGQLLMEHTRLMKEEYRIGQIPEARQALGEVWLQLTGGAFDPGGLMAPGGKMDLGARHHQ